jgi:segregation and condensation protein B
MDEKIDGQEQALEAGGPEEDILEEVEAAEAIEAQADSSPDSQPASESDAAQESDQPAETEELFEDADSANDSSTDSTEEANSQDNEDAQDSQESDDAEDEVEELSDDELRSVLEVLLFVSDKPLTINKIKDVTGGVGSKKIREVIELIGARLLDNNFPYQVKEVGGGYMLSTLPQYALWVRKLYSPKAKATKLTQAALETLAVVAYKQPVTRGEMEAIRGVNVDSTLKTLLDKRLAEIVGYKDVIGKPATYGTTTEFLLQFGLNTLTDLPSIEELRRSGSTQ